MLAYPPMNEQDAVQEATKVFLEVVGREPTPADIAGHVELMTRGEWSPSDFASYLRGSTTYSDLTPANLGFDGFANPYAGGTYLNSLYLSELGRLPDEEGLRFYQDQLNTGGKTFDQIIAEINASPEGMLHDLYQAELGRTPDAAGLNYYKNQLASGRTIDQIAAEISGSEWGLKYDPTNTVNYQNTLSYTYDPYTGEAVPDGPDAPDTPNTPNTPNPSNVGWQQSAYVNQNPYLEQNVTNDPSAGYGGLYNQFNMNDFITGNLSNAQIGNLAGMLYQAPSLANYNMAQYMNPYTQHVTDQTMNDLMRQQSMTRNMDDYAASQAGAFGGSRHGVAQAETNRNYADIGAQTYAGLNQANYGNAQNMALQQFQGDINAQGFRQAATNNMANLANLGFGMQQGVNQNLWDQGTYSQGLQQGVINNAMGQYQSWQGWPGTALGYGNSALGFMPNTSSTTQGYQPGFTDALGMGLSTYYNLTR